MGENGDYRGADWRTPESKSELPRKLGSRSYKKQKFEVLLNVKARHVPDCVHLSWQSYRRILVTERVRRQRLELAI